MGRGGSFCLTALRTPFGAPYSIAGALKIARLLGISRQTPYDILSRKQGVTPAIAVRLGKLFGDGGGIWPRMQMEHDLWRAEREVDTSGIERIETAA